jgi:hypothetical protein
MEAFLQKKKEWEFQNHQVLRRLVLSTTSLSKECVKAAGIIVSFLLYLVFVVVKAVFCIGAVFFHGPRLIRRVGPHQKPQAFHEFHPNHAEIQLRSRTNGLR